MANAITRFITGEDKKDAVSKDIIASAAALRDASQLTAMQMTADSKLRKLGMDLAIDLDEHRRLKAGDDPILNQLLAPFELGFVQDWSTQLNKSVNKDPWGF